MTTIDDIVEKLWETERLGSFDVLKIDIQGAEYFALRGAMKTLRYVEVIFIEIPVLQYNSGAPGFFKLHSLLHRLDFEMYDIFSGNANVDPIRTKDHQILVQFDAVFVRKTSSLWAHNCTSFPSPL